MKKIYVDENIGILQAYNIPYNTIDELIKRVTYFVNNCRNGNMTIKIQTNN